MQAKMQANMQTNMQTNSCRKIIAAISIFFSFVCVILVFKSLKHENENLVQVLFFYLLFMCCLNITRLMLVRMEESDEKLLQSSIQKKQDVLLGTNLAELV
jgi:IS4 transposase